MIFLSLDPSSTCTGYAVLERADKGLRMIEAGKLRGKSATSATARVLAMRKELLALLAEVEPEAVIVEMPIEKQYTRTKGKRSSMAVWAGAAWALWVTAVGWAEETNAENISYADGGGLGDDLTRIVYPISNTAWTKGTDKELRKAQVKVVCPSYDPADDEGGDVADAVALGMWWDQESRIVDI